MRHFLFVLLLTLWTAAGAVGVASAQDAGETGPNDRPIPHPIDVPRAFLDAMKQGTRSADGSPGPSYWQNRADYRLRARIDPAEKRLRGEAVIVYRNNSPDSLPVLYLNLLQNVHRDGAPRKVPLPVTGGARLHRVAVNGRPLRPVASDPDSALEVPGYRVVATLLEIRPPQAVAPGGQVSLELAWQFSIPKAGANHRMGWDADNLFFLAYWYPQMAVYDDVVGWQTDWFLGRAEFYAGFADYELTVEVPPNWVVAATGALQNPDQVLAPEVQRRRMSAMASDTVVHVITAQDFGRATRDGDGEGYLAWRFEAEDVRDVAFSATRESLWDAVRTPVGDRDGDGAIDHARVDAIYREAAPRWRRAAEYGRHAIDHHSQFTGLPYPWPHMTAVEGAGIITGGMEFPMMTLIGDYNARSDTALYRVTAHELGHMWFPMILSSDERRYAWLDEGTTNFNENRAAEEFYSGLMPDTAEQANYLALAGSAEEGEIMRRSDYHYSEDAYRVASYYKPAALLTALRAVLGEEIFLAAYRAFIRNWAFKHPYPWDLFHTFESESGRDLDWFWSSWYHATWTLDQAVAAVEETSQETRITIEDRGQVPMPVHLLITQRDGQVIRHRVPVDVWLRGARRTEVVVEGGPGVARVEIDDRRRFPDADRRNNVWPR